MTITTSYVTGWLRPETGQLKVAIAVQPPGPRGRSPLFLGLTKGPSPMTHRRTHALRNLMVAMLLVELVLLVPAVVFPNPTVRRVLFAVVLYTAVTLLLAFIFVVWATIDQLRKDVDEDEAVANAQLKRLAEKIAAHIELCEARHEDARMDSELAELFGGRQRSA